MRLEDLLPPGTEAVWTCGHASGAHCQECYRILAQRAFKLADALHQAANNLDRHKLLIEAGQARAALTYEDD